MLLHLVNFFIDALFPEKCSRCGRDGSVLCVTCLETRVERAPTDGIPDGVEAIFRYRDKLFSRALWRFKYTGNRTLASTFAEALNHELSSELHAAVQFAGEKQILLVSIPSSKKRLRVFGFNQSDALAHALANTSPHFVYEKNILVRTRVAPRQATLKNRKARLANMKDMFVVHEKNLVAGKSVIVIDDVTTTGATLIDAIKALKAAGARSARGLALSH